MCARYENATRVSNRSLRGNEGRRCGQRLWAKEVSATGAMICRNTFRNNFRVPEHPLVTSRSSSMSRRGTIHDARVKQYWERDRVLSHAMGEHDRSSVVWDYIAVYKPEQIWTDVPPQPESKGRPVVRFIGGVQSALDIIYSEPKKLN